MILAASSCEAIDGACEDDAAMAAAVAVVRGETYVAEATPTLSDEKLGFGRL